MIAISVPWPKAHIPLATAAVAPPDDPLGVKLWSHGLRVWPCKSFLVNHFNKNPGVLLRPIITPPTVQMFETTGLSLWEIRFF